MELIALPLVTALVAGSAHALEADHMAAVTTFVSRRPHPMRAFGFGVRWGLGHSLALLLAGGVVILLDLELPDRLVRGLEFGVGVMLVGLGLWVVAGALHIRVGDDGHRRAHSVGVAHSHLPGRGTTWVGMAHGLAGTAGFLALVPAAIIASPWMAGGYLLLFGLGTVLAMGAYALVAGALFHRVGSYAPALGRVMQGAAGVASAVIGAMWMHGALGA